METYCDKISLIQIKPEVCAFEVIPEVPQKTLRNEKPLRNINGGTSPKAVQTERSTAPQKVAITENDEAAEERQRTGRYLAIGVTLIMLFIAFYHTLLRHATVLAGLLAPAIIMLLYILWLFYFAKKKKTQVDFHAARLKNRTTLLYSQFEKEKAQVAKVQEGSITSRKSI